MKASIGKLLFAVFVLTIFLEANVQGAESQTVSQTYTEALKRYDSVGIPLFGDTTLSEGMTAVWKNGKVGFIDATGKEVVTPQYDDAFNFSEGMAAVASSDLIYGYYRWGFIDKSGKEIVPPFTYSHVNSFKNGLAYVEIGNGYMSKSGFIDKTGKPVVPIRYDYVGCVTMELYGIYFEGELTRFETGEWENWEGYHPGKWGFLDRTGKEIIAAKYDWVEDFRDGFAKVRLGEYQKNEQWGLIDEEGNEVVPSVYDDVGEVSDGMAAVWRDGKWSHIEIMNGESSIK